MQRLSYLILIISLSLLSISAHAGWQQTFADEFTGTSLNFSNWQTTNYWGQHNELQTNSLQCYVDSQVSVANDLVSLIASNQVPVGCTPDPGTLLYSSGEISTANSFRQAYGYFEIRAKLPKGQGMWPQFRLDIPGGSYPPQPPEIVVAQSYGSASQVMQQYSYIDSNYLVASQTNTVNSASDLSAGFHTYGVDWQPGLVIWYIDGLEVYRYANANVYSQPLYMVLNLAVGGTAPGNPDATTVFPSQMQIDYVHVYARINDGTPDTLPPGAVVPPPPGNPPKVAIILPFASSSVKRKSEVLLAAVAISKVKIASTTFSVNGSQVCSLKKPYDVCLWKVPADTSVSLYKITATATDINGLVGTSSINLTAK